MAEEWAGTHHPANLERQEEPGLVDGVRFLYQRRLGLAVRFAAFLGIGITAYLLTLMSSPTMAEGTISLMFRGIERHEYPTGKRFTVEDFRAPEILAKALNDAGVPRQVMDVQGLSSRLFVNPVIPADIQALWRKQEKEGSKKDEYFPNEFNVDIQIGGISNSQRLRLFDAFIKRYQERVKYEQKSALSFVAASDASYERLSSAYDFWDIPELFRSTHRSLDAQLKRLITESLQYQDSKYQLAFRDVAKDLDTWEATRLQALEAVTYQGRLVKNRDIMIQRLQFRIEDTDIQIRQKAHEVTEAERLLGLLDRPKALLAGQLSNDKGLPMVDVSALDKLIRSDYIGPLVDRISKLQQETQALEADKMRLEKQLTWLPKASNVDLGHLPPGYSELIRTLSSELGWIIQNYNRLLDDYLTATITSLVTVKQSPIITREGSSPKLIIPGIVFIGLFLAICLMSVEHLIQKAKKLASDSQHQGTP